MQNQTILGICLGLQSLMEYSDEEEGKMLRSLLVEKLIVLNETMLYQKKPKN